MFHQGFSSISLNATLVISESLGMSDIGMDPSLSIGCQMEKLPAQVKVAVYYQARFLTVLEELPCEMFHKTLCLLAVTFLLPILFLPSWFLFWIKRSQEDIIEIAFSVVKKKMLSVVCQFLLLFSQRTMKCVSLSFDCWCCILLSIFPIFKCCKRIINMWWSHINITIFNTCFSPPQILMSVKHLGSAWMDAVSTLMAPTDVNAFLDWLWVSMVVCVLVR